MRADKSLSRKGVEDKSLPTKERIAQARNTTGVKAASAALQVAAAAHKAQKQKRAKNHKGGSQPGAGRPRGHSKTRHLAFLLMQDGETPLGVMLKAMRAEWKKGYDEVKGAIKDRAAVERAVGHAKDAAPYVHPRLSSVEMVKNIGDSELDQLIAGLAAQAGVSLGAGGEGQARGVPAIEGTAERTGD